jgi:hypothetical protein
MPVIYDPRNDPRRYSNASSFIQLFYENPNVFCRCKRCRVWFMEHSACIENRVTELVGY